MVQQDASNQVLTRRRDRRYGLAPGAGSVEFAFEPGGACEGVLVEVSLAGLTFRTDVEPGVTAGSRLSGVTVRLAGSVVRGDLIVVRVCRLDRDAGFAAGCLFYPQVGAAEATWASIFSGTRLRTGAGSGTVAPSLVIRCGSCHGSICVFCTGEARVLVKCGTCLEAHALNLGHDLLKLEAAREGAREFALQNRIDLAGAYSVLFGIMTLDGVRDMFGSSPGTTNAALASEADSYADVIDPGFCESVEAGRLTVGQAMQRGSRAVFAAKLAERHRLSMNMALAVADNRVLLLDAVRRRAAEERAAAPPERVGRSARRLLLVALFVVVLTAAGSFETWRYQNWMQQNTQDAATLRQRRTIAATRVVQDESGRVTEISGLDPRRVLLAYCSTFTGYDRREPLEIAPLHPPDPGVRLGIFSDRQGIRYVIRIHRRGGARNWVAGGRGEPILVSDAPQIAPGTPTIPVRLVTPQGR